MRDGDGDGIIDTNTKQWQHQVVVAMENTTAESAQAMTLEKCARINLW